MLKDITMERLLKVASRWKKPAPPPPPHRHVECGLAEVEGTLKALAREGWICFDFHHKGEGRVIILFAQGVRPIIKRRRRNAAGTFDTPKVIEGEAG